MRCTEEEVAAFGFEDPRCWFRFADIRYEGRKPAWPIGLRFAAVNVQTASPVIPMAVVQRSSSRRRARLVLKTLSIRFIQISVQRNRRCIPWHDFELPASRPRSASFERRGDECAPNASAAIRACNGHPKVTDVSIVGLLAGPEVEQPKNGVAFDCKEKRTTRPLYGGNDGPLARASCSRPSGSRSGWRPASGGGLRAGRVCGPVSAPGGRTRPSAEPWPRTASRKQCRPSFPGRRLRAASSY